MESDEDALSTLFGSQFKKMNFKNKHIHICTSTYTYTKINNTYISYTYIYYSTGQIWILTRHLMILRSCCRFLRVINVQ